MGPVTAATILAACTRTTAGSVRKRPSQPSSALHRLWASVPTNRHRLNRYGDRQLNRALDVVARTRSLTDPATRAYIQRRTAKGRTPREIRRCLSNRYWLVWCLLAGWLPVLLDVTSAASGPSGSDGAFV